MGEMPTGGGLAESMNVSRLLLKQMDGGWGGAAGVSFSLPDLVSLATGWLRES